MRAQCVRPWKVDGEGQRDILWRKKYCTFPAVLLAQGKKGPEDSSLVRVSFLLC